MVKYNEKIFDFRGYYKYPGNGRAACSIHPKGMSLKSDNIKKGADMQEINI